MAKKKSSSPTTDGQKDSDKPPSPEAMDVTGAGALTGDGSAAMGGGGWASQHKGILIGGGIAVVVVVGYILIKTHGSSSGAQSGSTMPVTDLLGGPTVPSTNASAPGTASGYGGNGSASSIENAITQMEDALHTQSQQNTLAIQNALASQQASQASALQQLLAKIGSGTSSSSTPISAGTTTQYGTIPSNYTGGATTTDIYNPSQYTNGVYSGPGNYNMSGTSIDSQLANASTTNGYVMAN